MKNIPLTILAVCILTFGGVAAEAQWVNCSGNSFGNNCLGYSTLPANSGSYNTVFANYSMHSNTSGGGNAALGAYALNQNTTGTSNTAAGYQTLYSNTSGYFNTAAGIESLYSVTTGTGNVGIGYAGGYNLTTGNYNIDIGNEGSSGDDDVIRIGGSSGYGSGGFYAGGIFGATVSSGDGIEVLIGSGGQLGTVNSSIRFKKDVNNMGTASDRLFQLRPVTYRYKQAYANGSNPIEYGLIAEEVAQVYPDLVVKSADGQIQTVQYQKLTPMMLNELQKEHKLLEEQQAKIEQLEKQLAALPALEQRLAALEATRPSSDRLEARLATK
jgi:hypothetical protein